PLDRTFVAVQIMDCRRGCPKSADGTASSPAPMWRPEPSWLGSRTNSSTPVPEFQGNAWLFRCTKWSMYHPRGAAGVHSFRVELITDPLPPLKDVHFLPEVVDKYLRIVRIWWHHHDARHHHLLGILAQD